MEAQKRRILEPRSTFDRVLYAIMAFIGPMCLVSMYQIVPGDASVVFGIWCLISILYTIEWAINLYRKFRSRKEVGSTRNGAPRGL